MDTMTANAFPITVSATWTETDVIPPRCRNPRDFDHEIEHVVHVPMITAADFPVALIAHEHNSSTEYHLYDGHLYTPYLPNSRQTEMFTAGEAGFGANQRETGYHRYRTLDEMHDHISRRYSLLVIVDGKVWVRAVNEPYYQVSLDSDGWSGPRRAYISITNHGGQAEYTHFNASEREEAIDYALTRTPEDLKPEARKRLEDSQVRIEVLIPEAVHRTFNRVKANGENIISDYADQVESDFKRAMEHSKEFADAEAVGRGEITYREYLEAALKHLLEIEEPRQRAYEADRKAQFGY